MKEKIKTYTLDMGVDDVGFAALTDYDSPRSPKIDSFFPEAKSVVVLAYKELTSVGSENLNMAMSARQDLVSFARSCNYKLSRFLEREFKAHVMPVAPSGSPLNMSFQTGGTIAEFSLRHAALAAGLGTFGRNNLILHPRFGSRVVFSAVLSDLEIASDPRLQDDICIQCDICVENCPASALDEEGKTNTGRCLRNSQPYGMGANIGFWTKLMGSPLEEQKKMLRDENYWRLYQAAGMGTQYFCFRCEATCPIGIED